MTRPTRIQFPGAVYHITTRGNRRANMFVDERDNHIWLCIFAEAASRFNLRVYGLCLMPNHFHILFETPDANLSAAMHFLNGQYARKFNWRHDHTGHLTQRRFDAFLVDDQPYLLELLRYIVLNPVRTKLVAHADDWGWSTHRYCTGSAPPPAWFNPEWVQGQFSGATALDRIRAYRTFVDAGVPPGFRPKAGSPRGGMRHGPGTSVTPLAELEQIHRDRNSTIRAAWETRLYTREQIARHFCISTKTVSRITCA